LPELKWDELEQLPPASKNCMKWRKRFLKKKTKALV